VITAGSPRVEDRGVEDRPSYWWAFVSTFTGSVAAAVAMAIPSWLWADYVLEVKFNAIVGRAEELSTWDRVLLYAGNLLLVFGGLLIATWTARKLLNVFDDYDLHFWDVFTALACTWILAAIVGYFFPFAGLVIAAFVAPMAVLQWSAYAGQTTVGDVGARDQPLTSLRPG
jgi:hypothetical protein